MPDSPRPVDALPPEAALRAMLDGQQAALRVIEGALEQIAAASDLMAKTLKGGGRVVYVAAGSSGLMALADACELPGTFGIDPAQLRLAMAGGIPTGPWMPGHTEDETDTSAVDDLSEDDLVIALSASGTTPQACALADAAQARGVTVVALACVAEAPLLKRADVAIALPTPAEVVEGSTRLGAGTAQKAALNMLSTLAGIRLGHVHEGLMVNLRADNAKLRARATGIVARLAATDCDTAAAALRATDGNTKAAVLVAEGHDPATAARLLHDNDHDLRRALASERAMGACNTKSLLSRPTIQQGETT
ncbi:N-acetylmuramic acid 6-phosphate etherase [Sagittula salina]|uniref:N-acetylmuramic acid 6-phosphate etherase n=1 Tax=Sagittula salina TaxID=2820268 RepID=A0A940S0L8_9RHOB|nr:N-acetylmuramic acid 6-phosphate etherase [Sagittula salina]MBP0482162.1 N-acetylmuramic acid 6-phosphate etherase [Sagittula salina]